VIVLKNITIFLKNITIKFETPLSPVFIDLFSEGPDTKKMPDVGLLQWRFLLISIGSVIFLNKDEQVQPPCSRLVLQGVY
jgi:hypothetical protein